MDAQHYEISNGYIGSMGMSFEPATDATLREAVRLAAKFNDVSEAEIEYRLEQNTLVPWRESPNFYYDHSYGIIRRKRTAPRPKRDEGPMPHGQLWEPCNRRGCDNEPVCLDCGYCERHCGC